MIGALVLILYISAVRNTIETRILKIVLAQGIGKNRIYEASDTTGSRIKQGQDSEVERWPFLYLTHITPALQLQHHPREAF